MHQGVASAFQCSCSGIQDRGYWIPPPLLPIPVQKTPLPLLTSTGLPSSRMILSFSFSLLDRSLLTPPLQCIPLVPSHCWLPISFHSIPDLPPVPSSWWLLPSEIPAEVSELPSHLVSLPEWKLVCMAMVVL